MSLSMYSASAPVFLRMLGNLDRWLDRAAAHAEAKRFDPSVLVGARLAPDMLPLSKQVQIACDTAKFCMARLGGVDAPKHDDNEVTLSELKARVASTVAFIGSLGAERIEGSDAREISLPRRDGPLLLDGETYLKNFVLPNFYFHLTTCYALLRHNGVELGKADFLGPLTSPV